MLVLSASTADQSLLTGIQRQSVLLCGFAANEYLHLTIPKSYPKNPSWFRIRALLDHLPNHDLVLWLDSDAMLLRSIYQDKGFLFPNGHAVYVARDFNGFNLGVSCWRNTPQTRELLWRIYDAHDKFREHPWHEQGAFHCFVESVGVRVMPKHLFNAYPEDKTPESYILHLPNRTMAERQLIMGEELTKLKASGAKV